MRYVKGPIRNEYGSDFYENSIHYAFVKGGFMFIQANNSPFHSYETKNAFPEKIPATLTTNKKSDWLNKMNKIAKEKGYKIILNFHAYDDGYNWNQGVFEDFIKKSEVVAIFVGHFHRNLGTYDTLTNVNNSPVPVIYSGAMHLGSYLYVTFNQDKIHVEPRVIDLSPYQLSVNVFNSSERQSFDINLEPAYNVSFVNNSTGTFGYAARVRVLYEDGNGVTVRKGYYKLERNKSVSVEIPSNATGPRYAFEYLQTFAWKTAKKSDITSKTDQCYQISGKLENGPKVSTCR